MWVNNWELKENGNLKKILRSHVGVKLRGGYPSGDIWSVDKMLEKQSLNM